MSNDTGRDTATHDDERHPAPGAYLGHGPGGYFGSGPGTYLHDASKEATKRAPDTVEREEDK